MKKQEDLGHIVQSLQGILQQLDEQKLSIAAIKIAEAIAVLVPLVREKGPNKAD